MLDPLSQHTAPPPRYLLESDSSDEEGQGAYPSTSAPRRAPPAPRVSVRALGDDLDFTAVRSVVLGVGQAGKYLARRGNARMAVLEVDVDGVRLGTGFALGEAGDGVLLAMQDGGDEQGTAFDVVDGLAKLLPGVENWSLFSSYVPAMYIPDPREQLYTVDPPVRYISRGGKALEGVDKRIAAYDAPNYVTGLAGAFLSLATHPASPLPISAALTLFLLPLPFSTLAPAAAAAAIATLPPTAGKALARNVPWTEGDDEPFAALGMGKRPSKGKVFDTSTPTTDFGGMYM